MENKIYPYPKWERRLDNGNVGDHADWFQDVADIQTHNLKIVLQGIVPSDDKNKYEETYHWIVDNIIHDMYDGKRPLEDYKSLTKEYLQEEWGKTEEEAQKASEKIVTFSTQTPHYNEFKK